MVVSFLAKVYSSWHIAEHLFTYLFIYLNVLYFP
jgi:hypothetical protein